MVTLGGATASPVVINTVADLQAVAFNPNADYVLGQDIDATGVAFAPLGFYSGTFDGQGHTISNLSISGSGYAGLFTQIQTGATVKNLRLSHETVSATGFGSAGGLAVYNFGTIDNVHVDGSISGVQIGGLTFSNGNEAPGGAVPGVLIKNSSANVTLTSAVNGGAGGLSYINAGTIAGSRAMGSASGSGSCISGGCGAYSAGGAVSQNTGAIIDTSANVTITGSIIVAGGLVADMYDGSSIVRSYAEGDLMGTGDGAFLGGLVASPGGSITQAYARGSVTAITNSSTFAAAWVGSVFAGLFGGTINEVYGTGAVSGSATSPGVAILGGLAGAAGSGTGTADYWDLWSTGQLLSDGSGFGFGTGLTTAQLQSGLLPAGFDPTVWYVKAGYYPQFTPFPNVPEPASIALFGAALFFARRRRGLR